MTSHRWPAVREGKPVLAGNQDAGKEVVADGETGRTVNAQEKQQLLEGILDVSGKRAAAMGAAARCRYEQQFSYEMFAARFVERIRRVAGSGERGVES